MLCVCVRNFSLPFSLVSTTTSDGNTKTLSNSWVLNWLMYIIFAWKLYVCFTEFETFLRSTSGSKVSVEMFCLRRKDKNVNS